jgi:hypothetical protein
MLQSSAVNELYAALRFIFDELRIPGHRVHARVLRRGSGIESTATKGKRAHVLDEPAELSEESEKHVVALRERLRVGSRAGCSGCTRTRPGTRISAQRTEGVLDPQRRERTSTTPHGGQAPM